MIIQMPWNGPDDPSHLDHTVFTDRDFLMVVGVMVLAILINHYFHFARPLWRIVRKKWGYVALFAMAVLLGFLAADWDRIRDVMQPPPDRHGNGRTYHP